MKKKYFALGTSLLMCMSLLAGCTSEKKSGPSSEPQPDIPDVPVPAEEFELPKNIDEAKLLDVGELMSMMEMQDLVVQFMTETDYLDKMSGAKMRGASWGMEYYSYLAEKYHEEQTSEMKFYSNDVLVTDFSFDAYYSTAVTTNNDRYGVKGQSKEFFNDGHSYTRTEQEYEGNKDGSWEVYTPNSFVNYQTYIEDDLLPEFHYMQGIADKGDYYLVVGYTAQSDTASAYIGDQVDYNTIYVNEEVMAVSKDKKLQWAYRFAATYADRDLISGRLLDEYAMLYKNYEVIEYSYDTIPEYAEKAALVASVPAYHLDVYNHDHPIAAYWRKGQPTLDSTTGELTAVPTFSSQYSANTAIYVDDNRYGVNINFTAPYANTDEYCVLDVNSISVYLLKLTGENVGAQADYTADLTDNAYHYIQEAIATYLGGSFKTYNDVQYLLVPVDNIKPFAITIDVTTSGLTNVQIVDQLQIHELYI